VTGIKPGDRVRLTARREPTVTLEGEVTSIWAKEIAVRLATGAFTNSFHISQWDIEKIVPPTIDYVKTLKVGAVLDRGPSSSPLTKFDAERWSNVGGGIWYDPDVADLLDNMRYGYQAKIVFEGIDRSG